MITDHEMLKIAYINPKHLDNGNKLLLF